MFVATAWTDAFECISRRPSIWWPVEHDGALGEKSQVFVTGKVCARGMIHETKFEPNATE